MIGSDAGGIAKIDLSPLFLRHSPADRVKAIRSRAITIVRRAAAHFARSGREQPLGVTAGAPPRLFRPGMHLA